MIVASSSAARVGVPTSGPWAAQAASQPVKRRFAPSGASGKAMQGNSAGIPGSIEAQSSSLPTKSREAPLWASKSRTEVPVSVGYSGTDTWPAIQIAQSAISQCAQFFEISAIREPGGRPSDCRCAAMRRVSMSASPQVQWRTSPGP